MGVGVGVFVGVGDGVRVGVGVGGQVTVHPADELPLPHPDKLTELLRVAQEPAGQ